MDLSDNQAHRPTPRRRARLAAQLSSFVLCLSLVACKRDPEPVIPEATEPPVAEPSAADGSGTAAPTPTPGPPAQEVPTVAERRPDVEANRELAASLGLAPPDPLLVSDLLTRADVRELAGFRGELLETSLEGIAPSPDYNTIRLQADGGYGFALQLWQHDEVRQLSTHFRRLQETYFDSAPETAGVANEAFTADFLGIRHYGFMHRASKSVAVVTCDEALCDPTQIRALAQRVANRL